MTANPDLKERKRVYRLSLKCAHEEMTHWRGGGFNKAQCQHCLTHGLQSRLFRERKERLKAKEIMEKEED